MPQEKDTGGVKGGKPFILDQRWFVRAWEQVRKNRGGPGVDGVTIEQFESRLDDELFKLWNRMSSGTYFPKPVKAVPIPKPDGGVRVLGVPTVADRVAQTVVANLAQAGMESVFLPDSYGFRRGRGALDAVGKARERCQHYDWVVDLDIAKFFDSVDHELLMRVVEWQGWPRWAVICVQRWITAPMMDVDGQVSPRERGTPQGGVISPVLANLFLHVVFDTWMVREFPGVPFERYADDAICHCSTRRLAHELVERLRQRFTQCGLELHPVKTKIVYCQDSNRRGTGLGPTRFTFLGYEFRARTVKGKYGLFDAFRPGVDPVKRAGMISTIRNWRLPKRTGATWDELAEWINPVVRGWMNYYARFAAQEFAPVLSYLNWRLFAWMRAKHRYRSVKKALRQWKRITRFGLFVHWQDPHPNTYVAFQ